MRFYLLLSIVFSFGFQHVIAELVTDQRQMLYDDWGDLSAFGDSGQTFTAGTNGLLGGISLYVMGSGYYDEVKGSDMIISLHSVVDNVLTGPVLATGFLLHEGIITPDELGWVTVWFDSPYEQVEGEGLAFTILETSQGGAFGWNEFGFASSNPYSGGQDFITYENGVPLVLSDDDMTFQTVMVPEPNSGLLLLVGSIATVWYRRHKKLC